MKKVLALVLVAIMLLCSVAMAEETIKIGFANLTDSGDYMVWVKKGMQQAAEAAGVELICVDNEGDGVKAVQNIDTLISAGVDAVIEYMNDTTVNSQIKDMLDAAGIPCVAVDVPVENANGKAAYMGGDNYTAGFICGENLGQAAIDKWGGEIDLYISVETMSNGETNTLRNGGRQPQVGQQPDKRVGTGNDKEDGPHGLTSIISRLDQALQVDLPVDKHGHDNGVQAGHGSRFGWGKESAVNAAQNNHWHQDRQDGFLECL